MKLWQKAAAVCAGVLLAVMAVCSSVLLLYAQNSILALSETQTEDRQQTLTASFQSMTDYYLLDSDPTAVRESLTRYCFTRFADGTSVLTREDETVFTLQDLSPAEHMPWQDLTGRPQVLPVRDGDARYLIAGSLVTVGGEPYGVYTVRDVSDVYRSIRTMTAVFVLIALGGVVLGTLLITVLMRRGARPVRDLAAAARRIAGGDYGFRAEVSGRDETSALAADFNAMADAVQTRIGQLSDTAQRQELFIAGAAHEFKTPLASMLLHTQLLRSANMTDQERDRSLARIEDQCRWLERLTRTLLQLLTLRQTPPLWTQPLRGIIDQVRTWAEPALAGRGVSLNTDCDSTAAPVNGELLCSLLMNLVDNAAKSYDPGAPDPAVWLTCRDGVLEVLDRGRGIPPEALPHIFEPFFMADKSRSKKQGGSGLGLALVKTIADVHGAKLEVVSAPGQGTSVRVLLKLQNDYNELIDSPPPSVQE